jgi:hypothetical protein
VRTGLVFKKLWRRLPQGLKPIEVVGGDVGVKTPTYQPIFFFG